MEAIFNVKTIKAFCAQDQITLQLRELPENVHEQTGAACSQRWLGFWNFSSGDICSQFFCIMDLAVMVKRNHSEPWPALKVYQILACVGFLLAEVCNLVPEITKGEGAINSLLEMANKDTSIDSDSADGLQPCEVAGHIEFEDVTFSYPGRPVYKVIHAVNLIVHAGHTVALLGPSGFGKSTILALLESFYDPASGRILLDGLDMKLLNLRWLRKHIGLVHQEPALFALSIRDNIMYGNETMSEAEMTEAARKANAHGFISSLPQAYDTRVGEGGVHLSRGQKQRIAVARAIIQNPRILLLDDATSSLDSESGKVVQDALDNIMLEEERVTTF